MREHFKMAANQAENRGNPLKAQISPYQIVLLASVEIETC